MVLLLLRLMLLLLALQALTVVRAEALRKKWTLLLLLLARTKERKEGLGRLCRNLHLAQGRSRRRLVSWATLGLIGVFGCISLACSGAGRKAGSVRT